MSTTAILLLALYRQMGDGSKSSSSSSSSGSSSSGDAPVKPIRLASVTDLSSFNYFTRGTIAEHLRFASRTVVGRTSSGCRQTVGLSDNPFLVHVYVRYDGLAGVVVTQKDYNVRVAYSLINKMMHDYEQQYPAWKRINADQDVEPAAMKKDIQLYQNPAEADKLTAIQKNLDEVKDIMHKNIEQVLNRGETLDSLMEKSDDLSVTSHAFYKNAKKQNQCCKAY